MNYKSTAKISITLNNQLLSRLDGLAKRKYASRSYILRAALAEYLDKPANASAETNKIIYADILAEHPHLSPDDTVMLEILKSVKQDDEPEV